MKLGGSATGHIRELRTVIVDDSALARLLLRDALSHIPGVRVVGNASEGTAAIEVVDAVEPDLVTLDIDMPGFDSLGVLKQLKLRHPDLIVLVCSRTSDPDANSHSEALMSGAFDVIRIPSSRNRDQNVQQLSVRIADRLAPLIERRLAGNVESQDRLQCVATETQPVVVTSDGRSECATSTQVAPPPASDRDGRTIDIVLIGCSTGGPAALRRLLAGLRGDLEVPVCIIQHIPPGFSKPLAHRLNQNCSLPVIEATDAMPLKPGNVYLAPGGRHLLIEGSIADPVLVLGDGEAEHGCRPAIDVTLRSAFHVYGAHALVVILTGMGRDGAAGADVIRSRGGKVFVQTPESSTVSSMPRQTLDTAGADAVGELNELSRWINETVH